MTQIPAATELNLPNLVAMDMSDLLNELDSFDQIMYKKETSTLDMSATEIDQYC